jgi:hypothetical protein
MKTASFTAALLLAASMGFASTVIAAPTTEVTVAATGDAAINAHVTAELAKYPALAANLISVHTEDGLSI